MLFAPKTCIQSIEPSNSCCGLADFLSQTCPHKKFHNRLETTGDDSPAGALPCLQAVPKENNVDSAFSAGRRIGLLANMFCMGTSFSKEATVSNGCNQVSGSDTT